MRFNLTELNTVKAQVRNFDPNAVIYVPWPSDAGDCDANFCHFNLCPGGAGNFVTQAWCSYYLGTVCACDYTPP